MRLDLSRNSISNCGMRIFTDILGIYYSKNAISMNLSYLNLSSNSISSNGFEYFCRGMSANRTLETVILDDNPLGEGERFFNIKFYLSKNWGLKKLSLSNVSLHEKDLKFVSEGMESNRSLEELNLSKNEIEGESLSFIWLMLAKNKSLRHLRLNCCKISDSCLMKH
jgi:Ran GTPase-activating protein (RanGAP) involved in mRNA processing and transport